MVQQETTRNPEPGTRSVTGVARIAATFAAAKARGAAAFIPYVTVGHPDLDTADTVIPALIEGGADIIEVGVPFSDPLADGPVIQRSTQTALDNGVTLDYCLDTVRRLRAAGVTAPLILFGYTNPFLQRGAEGFAAACEQAGVDGVMVPDLPLEEAGELRAAFDRHGLAFSPFLAPTSTPERIAKAAELATGFVYCIGLVGITGERDALAPGLAAYLDRVREQVKVPLAVGFGISRPEHVAVVGQIAEGVVVGTAVVRRLGELPPEGRAAGAAAFVRWLRGESEDERR